MRTRNKIIKEVIQCAEINGWHVDAEKHQDKNIVIFEFSQFTPAGQDFFFSATAGQQRTRQKRRTLPNEGCAGRHGSGGGDGQ